MPYVTIRYTFIEMHWIQILERLCSMNECGQLMEWKILHLKRKFHNLEKNTSFVFLLYFLYHVDWVIEIKLSYLGGYYMVYIYERTFALTSFLL